MSHFTNPFANYPSSTKPSSTFQTDNISNSTATEYTGKNNICMRTGFKVKPGTLVEDAYGSLVRFESMDKRHPQELIRPLAESLTGPVRPEPSDSFIATSISPEDL